MSAHAVLHVLPWYAPRSWGGTEQFVHSLCLSLPSLGFRSEVAVVDGELHAPTEHGGVRLHRIDDGTPERAAACVVERAREIGASVVDLHAWTPLTGMALVREARAAGLRCVVHLHVPTLTCARGTMLLHGRQPCDGRLDVRRCSACWLRSRGVPALAAEAIAALPCGLAAGFARHAPHRRLRTALGASASLRRRIDEVTSAFAVVDRIVVPAGWLAAALHEAGMDPARLDVCRPGLDAGWAAHLRSIAAAPPGAVLEVLFVGRWDPSKGLDVLLDAAARVQGTAKLRLTVCCTPAATADAASERERLLRRWGRAPWLRVVESADRRRLAALYRESAVVAIPSRCMETGPIVALEALAAGCALIGSAIGGIRESLEGRAGCRLLPIDDPGAWAQALRELAEEPPRARVAAADIRDGDAVAAEMARIYRRVMPDGGA